MASSASSKREEPASAKRPNSQPNESQISEEVSAMLLPSLYRLTEGLPRKELKMMISEAMICEESLEKEIRQLQDALDNPGSEASETPSVQIMLDSEVTPPDRFFTISALLGRLRDDLATPLPPNSILPELRAQGGLAPPKKKKKDSNQTLNSAADPNASAQASTLSSSTTLEKQKRVLSLYQLPEYTKEHDVPNALMALWKKISSHRSSIVFRRPVNPKEAPGYTERIAFPMDLSLIRKMIVARQIKSYSELHQRLGLICHNCVKYNGRESDYGIVTRDFESNADEMVAAAVFTATQEARNPRATSANSPPTGATMSTQVMPATKSMASSTGHTNTTPASNVEKSASASAKSSGPEVDKGKARMEEDQTTPSSETSEPSKPALKTSDSSSNVSMSTAPEGKGEGK